MSVKIKKHYDSRVQYRAVRWEVENLLIAGYSASHIYRKLVKAGDLTISYSSFCDYVRGGGERQHVVIDEYRAPASECADEAAETDSAASPGRPTLH